ncbi:hypothetical protein EZS27_032428 [termite gut metagenome]|uniref:ATPase AAA-type core domain-containing protein n=1 Tax=termite gut metagenome TaxID=433724 RepID=A0A5J4QA21_9ZZZZ
MKRFVITSSKESQKGDEIDIEPFKLNDETEAFPSEFEIVFISNGTMYRYGFETDKKQIVSEWLYYKPKTKEIELFYRDYQNIKIHPKNFNKGNTLIKGGLIRNNALLVSVAAQFNDSTSIAVIDWFKKLKIISGLHEEGYQGFTVGQIEGSTYKSKIIELLKVADLGIKDIKIERMDVESLPKDMPKELKEKIVKEVNEGKAEIYSDVLTTHKKYDIYKNVIGNMIFSMSGDESSGTQKIFSLSGPILNVIENGYILVVDELDSKLHPNLVCKIVSIFNSKELNPKNAQLIFNTQDTNLLSSGLFRRDQIWFTEKNRYGEVRLYSLADFKSDEVRKADSFEDNYLKGKYGAVPFLDSFDNLNKILSQYENEEQKS